tara:strand:+ start:719 stop:919 length:201 start_codon:yes stop_codon:yes gene_type:complete
MPDHKRSAEQPKAGPEGVSEANNSGMTFFRGSLTSKKTQGELAVGVIHLLSAITAWHFSMVDYACG